MLKKEEYRRTYVVVPLVPGVVALVLKSEDGVQVYEAFENDAVLGDLVSQARAKGFEPRHRA